MMHRLVMKSIERAIPSGWPTGPGGDCGPEFAADRLGFLERAGRYDDFVPFRVGATQAVLLAHPELAVEVLASPTARCFSKDYLTGLIPPLVRRHLELRDPDSWLPERRLAQPAFHHDRLFDYATVMRDEIARMTAGWQVGGEVEIPSATRRLTLRILCRALFNVDLGRATDRAAAMVDLLLEAVDDRLEHVTGDRPFLPTARDLQRIWTLIRLERLFARLVRERRRGRGQGASHCGYIRPAGASGARPSRTAWSAANPSRPARWSGSAPG